MTKMADAAELDIEELATALDSEGQRAERLLEAHVQRITKAAQAAPQQQQAELPAAAACPASGGSGAVPGEPVSTSAEGWSSKLAAQLEGGRASAPH